MAEISADTVKTLRERTGVGMMECKKALAETGGDIDKAVDLLRKRGAATAEKKASRMAKEGVVASYIHLGGKVGVLVEINCETDFVAKNEKFKEFAKDITLHIAASSPLYVAREDVPAEVVEREKEIFVAQLRNDAKNANKPPEVLDKIVSGKVDKFYQTICLLEQGFVRDPDVTIRQLATKQIQELGENIVIKRFVRFQVGETAQ